MRVLLAESSPTRRLGTAALLARLPNAGLVAAVATVPPLHEWLRGDAAADVAYVGSFGNPPAAVELIAHARPSLPIVLAVDTAKPAAGRAADDPRLSVVALHEDLAVVRDTLRAAAEGRRTVSLLIGDRVESPLTPRHTEILNMLAEGLSRAEIGRRLGLSENTVRAHMRTMFEKLGVNERAAAVAVAIREQLID